MYRGNTGKGGADSAVSTATALLDLNLFPGEAGIRNAGEPESPLTLALFRSRWLTSYSTPCHARGATFLLGSGGESAR